MRWKAAWPHACGERGEVGVVRLEGREASDERMKRGRNISGHPAGKWGGASVRAADGRKGRLGDDEELLVVEGRLARRRTRGGGGRAVVGGQHAVARAMHGRVEEGSAVEGADQAGARDREAAVRAEERRLLLWGARQAGGAAVAGSADSGVPVELRLRPRLAQ